MNDSLLRVVSMLANPAALIAYTTAIKVDNVMAEIYCQLFDDFLIEDIMADNSSILSIHQQHRLQDLARTLRNNDNIIKLNSLEEILKSLEYNSIRSAAVYTLTAFFQPSDAPDVN